MVAMMMNHNDVVMVVVIMMKAAMMHDDDMVGHGRDRREGDGRSQDDRRNNLLQHPNPLIVFLFESHGRAVIPSSKYLNRDLNGG